MPFMQLKFSPGIVKDNTRYSSGGTWVDGNLVRFRNGFPEVWDGWEKATTDFQFSGYCRSIHSNTDLTGSVWYGVGTNRRFYVVSDGLGTDVSPVDAAASLGTDPIETSSGTGTITVSHTAHGHRVGDILIIAGATDTGGISASVINAEHEISAYIDEDTYQIEVSGTASSSATGGGGSVTVTYYVLIGDQDQNTTGGGFGSGGWAEEVFGGDPSVSGNGRLGMWSQASWGEDIVANIYKDGIFYWDATNPTTRMVNILDLAGADGYAPESSRFIAMSHKDRHLISFGCTEYGGSVTNPMCVRWCSQEDITDWDEASTTGTAGSFILSSGSRLVSAKVTQNEILVWSDTSLYSMQYIGADYIFGVQILDSNIKISGLKSPVSYGGITYWIGSSGIYAFDGTVKKVPCPDWDYIKDDINWDQSEKIIGSSNKTHDEIIWFYQSNSSDNDTDKYIAMSLADGSWTIGSLARGYWLDTTFGSYPMAAGHDGYLYAHNYGTSDGSQSPATALEAYIESAPFELSSEGSFDKGDRMMFIRRIFPDIMSKNTGASANVNIVIKMMDKPGSGFGASSSSQVTPSAIIPVQEFTDECHVRLRGRSMTMRIESSAVDSSWRLGVPRIDVRPDGQR